MTEPVILSLDQGTTSTRCIAVNRAGQVIASAQRDLQQHYPKSGWVEHDANQIWQDALFCLKGVLLQLGSEYTPSALGITNQRETTIIWDRDTGHPIHNAIVWQDRRTADICNRLKSDGHERLVQSKTGLLLDPYFSASKIAWLLDHVEGASEAAEAGKLAFGTVECFLLWKLTGGAAHMSDETNAARTSLWNIHSGAWDKELLDLFSIPASLLPEVRTSSGFFGETHKDLFGFILPITGMAGDQQSASFGQLCLSPGDIKATYGTGCFVIMNTGESAKASANRLLTTRACRIGQKPQFALEGSIYMAGAISQWLRDEMGLIAHASETEDIAHSVPDTGGVVLVPAFTGLGAPYWDSDIKAAIFGMTRATGRAHIVRAAMEAVAYQTVDLISAFESDAGVSSIMRVDGGMAANDWLMQYIADITRLPLERPQNLESTAMGAAFLAGLHVGVWNSIETLERIGSYRQRFETGAITADEREEKMDRWHRAISAAQSFVSEYT